MDDRQFLVWIHDRLHAVHSEPEGIDYMSKLRSIIQTIPEGQVTPNTGPSIESLRN